MGTTKSFSWFIWLKVYVGKICPVWPGNVIPDLTWSRVKRNEILNIKEFEGVIKYDEISMYHHAKLREKSHVEFQTVFNLKNGKCKQVKKMDWEFRV